MVIAFTSIGCHLIIKIHMIEKLQKELEFLTSKLLNEWDMITKNNSLGRIWKSWISFNLELHWTNSLFFSTTKNEYKIKLAEYRNNNFLVVSFFSCCLFSFQVCSGICILR